MHKGKDFLSLRGFYTDIPFQEKTHVILCKACVSFCESRCLANVKHCWVINRRLSYGFSKFKNMLKTFWTCAKYVVFVYLKRLYHQEKYLLPSTAIFLGRFKDGWQFFFLQLPGQCQPSLKLSKNMAVVGTQRITSSDLKKEASDFSQLDQCSFAIFTLIRETLERIASTATLLQSKKYNI